MNMLRIVYWKLEEGFLVEWAGGFQRHLRYGHAHEVYGQYAPVWSKFEEAVGNPGEWVETEFRSNA